MRALLLATALLTPFAPSVANEATQTSDDVTNAITTEVIVTEAAVTETAATETAATEASALEVAGATAADGANPAVESGEVTPAVVSQSELPSLFQAQLREHSADEILQLLTRAEKIAAGEDEYQTQEPVVLVLFGSEIELFKRENYRTNKPLVDLAARLDAFNIVDVKVCSHWTSQRGIELTDLPPFIEGVPSGDQEMKRLEKAGYAYF